MGYILGQKYLNDLIEGNQELFSEALDDLDIYGELSLYGEIMCYKIARENFVNLNIVNDFVDKCDDQKIKNDLLKNEIEKIYCQCLSKMYREILIGNVVHMLQSQSTQDVSNYIYKELLDLEGRNAKGFIQTLSLSKLYSKSEVPAFA